MTTELLLGIAVLALMAFVFVAFAIHLVYLVADALHVRMRKPSGMDRATLDVQNHIGDPDDPTSGVPS